MPTKTKKKVVKKSKLIAALAPATNLGYTENGALTNTTSGTAVLDFFAQGAAMRNRPETDIISLFEKAYKEDFLLALKTLFYFRDVRKGQGERRLFRIIFNWLAKGGSEGESAAKLLPLIAEYGRWDDVLESLEGTPLETAALALCAAQFKTDSKTKAPSLFPKWCASENASSATTKRLAFKLRSFLKLSPKAYRQSLSKMRAKLNLVETAMCSNEWGGIEYSHVPSRAGFIYRKAFGTHDHERYDKWLNSVEKGEAKVNASTLYPYDIVRVLLNGTGGQEKLLNEQWKALPDYFDGKAYNALVVCDTSGSMQIDDKIRPLDVSVSLAMYCAERNQGPFKDHFITFSANPELVKLTGANVAERARNLSQAAWGVNTNIQAVFDLVLAQGKASKVKQSEMPATLLIISDMEFDVACAGNQSTNFAGIKAKYEASGYTMPQLVFWNVNAKGANSPVTVNDKGTCLVSGCSPSILKSVLTRKVISPMDVLLQTINVDRYQAVEDALNA